jgi:hypothetical protein
MEDIGKRIEDTTYRSRNTGYKIPGCKIQARVFKRVA